MEFPVTLDFLEDFEFFLKVCKKGKIIKLGEHKQSKTKSLGFDHTKMNMLKKRKREMELAIRENITDPESQIIP